MLPNKPKFIVIEGLDGSGKTTAVNFIKALYDHAGIAAVTTREPGGTPFSEAIRDIVKSNVSKGVSPTALALLVNAGRRDAVEKIVKPSLAEGKTVICDRFTFSTLVYQAGGEHLPLLNEIGAGIQPDLILVLNVNYQTAYKRVYGRGLVAKDHWDAASESEFNRRREILFKAAVDTENAVMVDANGDRETVEENIYKVLMDCL